MLKFASLAGSFAAVVLLAACGTSTGKAAPKAEPYNQADADYLGPMNQLHGQLTSYSLQAAARAASPEVKALAATLSAHGGGMFDQNVVWMKAAGDQPGLTMKEDHGDSNGAIPGFIGSQDDTKLGQAKGAAYDRTFVTLMIANIQGDITMSRSEVAAGRNDAVKAFAQAELQQHTADVQRMQTLLAQLPTR
ncbi:MAG: DUF305 domain-containing protein [Catenulispora sp.]|nr:DUF305 domain-containing protein [Catenulispora sp.]NUR61015.1 DUF305 domain-containing protein [Catenulispora sp.]